MIFKKVKISTIIQLRVFIIILLVMPLQCIFSQKVTVEPYRWKNVQMVGGGFVDGIVFHPTEKNLYYCRTDIGGAYRWNAEKLRWEPLMDWVSYEDRNLMGVESIALDPSDPNRLYLACGTYTAPDVPNGAVLRSDDRGQTFQRTDMPFKMGGNENGRGNGERMAVDPNNGKIIFLGTRHDGLWRSVDRAVTWTKVATFPDISEPMPDTLKNEREKRWWSWIHKGSGVVFVIYDPKSGHKGMGSKTIYAGASLMNRSNLFRSEDGGATWKAVPEQPEQYRPNHAVLAKDGMLYITYGTNPGPWRMFNGGVWKLNTLTGKWTDITPDKPDPKNNRAFGYAAVAVDAHHPETLIVSTFYYPGGEDIYRSTDGGSTWKPVFRGGGTYDFSLAPYVSHTGIHWLFDIEIDPANPDHAMFTTGFGGFETFDLTDMDKNKPTKWSVMTTGIEETVALDLLSPPRGAHLISAIGDYGGFVHWDLNKPAPEGNFINPHFGNTDGLDCAYEKPEIIVRVGNASHDSKVKCNIGYSLDEGKSWQPTVAMPEPGSKHGSIAVSADGRSWIWTPEKSAVYVTHDRGTFWKKCSGVPENTRIIADKVNPAKFYGMDLFGGKLFVSSDSGNTFKEQTLILPGGLPETKSGRGDSRGGQDRIYATPGNEGDLWLAAFDGLYHSPDEGNTFKKIDLVQEMQGFGFGKAAPGSSYPALYMIGVVKGIRGFFRSDDKAANWVRINDDKHQYGLVLQITGDPRIYRRVYVGTHGRGTVYGDPAD